MHKSLIIAALVISGTLSAVAHAQVAGSMSLGKDFTDIDQPAPGWSVKKSILGKFVYNEQGEKVGKVQDLIIDPTRNVSYLIIGAGGFIGVGRHDVAVPASMIKALDGKIVLPGATKDVVKAMPSFEYTSKAAKAAKGK